ncbi:uroporphyrinogen-III synthase [Alicyclobacillus suci]|uniref:uroporphyrinogen-III synthase n=1 Tax=Alicyclobacillus suci TaxID=2816080 RepID=UPI001A8D9899|nr:uroporphyrinogen-III synthase [Alicyclobacillus suci]
MNSTVVITQSGDRGRSLVDRLTGLGVCAIHWPLVKTVVYSDSDIARQCRCLPEQVDGILVTSLTAARVLAKQYPSRDWRWGQAVCYCIGEATATPLRDIGVRCVVYPQVRDASDLAHAILSEWPNGGKTFVFARGVQARRVLVAALRDGGHKVFELEVYDTVPTPVEQLPRLPVNRALVWVLFSPSGVSSLLQSVAHIRADVQQGRSAVVAFGRTTASALDSAGIPVALMPTELTHDGLIDTLLQFLKEEEEYGI